MQRRPNPSQTASIVPTSGASTDDSYGADPFFLSWGSSVNVCEDLRRSIRTEIDDIDASITNLQGNIKNEERTATQLTKDLTHAGAEMNDLRRSAADELDGATMSEQVRHRLMEALKSELMAPVSDVSAGSQSPASTDVSSTKDDSSSPVGSVSRSHAPPNIRNYLTKRAAELNDASASIERERECVVQMKATKEELNKETQSILDKIENDKLVEHLANKEKEVESLVQECNNEMRRKQNTKVAVQQARAQCGYHAQQIADNTKTLTSTKSKNAVKEAEMALLVEQAAAKVRERHSTSAELESRLERATNEVEHFSKQLKEFDAICKAKEAKERERQNVKAETEELMKANQDLQGKLAIAREKCTVSTAELQNANALYASVRIQRNENDKFESDAAHTVEAEKTKLMKEREDLARIMSDLHEKYTADEQELKDKMSKQMEKMNALVEETNIDTLVLGEKLTELENLKFTKEEDSDAARKELEAHKDFCTKFEEATAAENARAAVLRTEFEKKRNERIEVARFETARLRSELERKLDILRCGVELIYATRRTITQLEQLPPSADGP